MYIEVSPRRRTPDAARARARRPPLPGQLPSVLYFCSPFSANSNRNTPTHRRLARATDTTRARVCKTPQASTRPVHAAALVAPLIGCPPQQGRGRCQDHLHHAAVRQCAMMHQMGQVIGSCQSWCTSRIQKVWTFSTCLVGAIRATSCGGHVLQLGCNIFHQQNMNIDSGQMCSLLASCRKNAANIGNSTEEHQRKYIRRILCVTASCTGRAASIQIWITSRVPTSWETWRAAASA